MSDFNRNSIVIGITGGIACGKSEVGRILEETGFSLCDADVVAHRLMMPGTVVYDEVVKHFGSQILQENGEISRSVLGQIIFENPDERNVLNGLVHPAIRNELTTWIMDRRSRSLNAAVQIPLLYESGMESLDLDAVICVSSPQELMCERLRRRGFSRKEALKRIASQMPVSEKEKRADAVIHNQGTLKELENATRLAVKAVSVER